MMILDKNPGRVTPCRSRNDLQHFKRESAKQ
jgi:hypothetical protein